MKQSMNLAQFVIFLESFNANIDIPLIKRAYEFSAKAHAGQLRENGDPFIEHCLGVALILAEQHMDSVSIAAGLLHDVLEDTPTPPEQLRKEFGDEIAQMVNGLTKLSRIDCGRATDEVVGYFRKMILTMAEDIRVVVIKLADRLHNMRTIDPLDEVRRRQIALETREIYAPLAHRLGMAKIRCELEDLAFRVLEPENYEFLERKIRESREEREAYIKEVCGPLTVALKKEGIEAEISGRAKHLQSIWRKMQQRQLPFEQIYDLLAIRVIVDSISDCYKTLGVVHTLWTALPERFHDYISNEKQNRYQSLHTTVIGPRGRPVEIQIRTKQMHHVAEFGVAAHWVYKQGKWRLDATDRRIKALLEEMVDLGKELANPEDFMDALKIGLTKETIFVYTPKRDLKLLPKGATALDFAFAVHSEIGFHCCGALVDNKVVPLSTELESGQEVKIKTSPHRHPSADWLKIVKTPRAKAKIKQWLNQQGYNQAVALGREIFERELRRRRLSKPNDTQLLDMAQAMGFSDTEQLMARLGGGAISASAVVNRLEAMQKQAKQRLLHRVSLPLHRRPISVRMVGADNFMFRLGACCQPLPGEEIIGFVTRGRGITVHRADCSVIATIDEPDRKIELNWDVGAGESFLIHLEVQALERPNLLKDITDALAGENINVRRAEIRDDQSSADGAPATAHFVLEVTNLAQLNRARKRVKRVPGVLRVERAKGSSQDVF